MPEGRQIGRGVCIEHLENRLATPAHQWLIGQRRIGKTSVAKAVLARLQKQGHVTLDLDLSKLQLSDSQALAGEIARQGRAAGAGNSGEAQRLFGIVRKHKKNAKALGNLLKELGFEEEGQALAAVSAILAEGDGGAPGLDRVLGALALHAAATGQRVHLLFDEIHLLANLDGAPEQIAKWCREENSPLVFIFAGSEESAAQALREPGQPLAAIGEEFKLTEIAAEDWIPGLKDRFGEAGVKIERRELKSILSASECHPRRTMLVSSRVSASARAAPEAIATPTMVELAIKDAEEDRSWR